MGCCCVTGFKGWSSVAAFIAGAGVVGIGAWMTRTPAPSSLRDVLPAAFVQPEMDEKAMMEMMEKLGAPGEHHKKLADMVGTWDAKCEFMGMDGKMTTTMGSCTNKWILGGRYIMSEFKGTFDGKPFEGIGIQGYDNATNKYVNLWLDTMSTTYLATSGSFDDAGKVLTQSGSCDMPMVGKCDFRMVSTVVSKDEHKFEMHQAMGGAPESLAGTITYTRKK